MHFGAQLTPFNEISIGDTAEFEVTIDERMHNSFKELFSDFSPIHCDDVFCANTKFGKKIGYGFMLTGLLSRFYGEFLPGGNSICIMQEAKFIQPFFVGDRLRVFGKVVCKIESTRFIEIINEIYRSDGVRVFEGRGIVQTIM